MLGITWTASKARNAVAALVGAIVMKGVIDPLSPHWIVERPAGAGPLPTSLQ